MTYEVTVITPVRNDAKHIEGTISSVLSQNGVNVEYIVVDGASTDGTLLIVARFERFGVRLTSEPDKGLYDAINKGIRLATTGRIVVLNSGDYYASEHALRLLVERSIVENDKKIVYGRMLVQNEDGSGSELVTLPDQNGAFMLRGCDVPHPTTLVPREVYRHHGGYRQSFRVMGDYDLLLRLHMAGVGFSGVDETLVVFQRGGLSSVFWQNVPESFRARLENGVSLPVNLLFTLRSMLYYVVRSALRALGLGAAVDLLTRVRRRLKL
jgi:glycosyltransferase involved in cell wall biosynthesis